MLPNSVGLFVFSLTIFSIMGAAIGVVVTAVSAAALEPTRRTLSLNAALGAVGFDLGSPLCAALGGDDFRVCSIALSVAFTVGHEMTRYLSQRRSLR